VLNIQRRIDVDAAASSSSTSMYRFGCGCQAHWCAQARQPAPARACAPAARRGPFPREPGSCSRSAGAGLLQPSTRAIVSARLCVSTIPMTTSTPRDGAPGGRQHLVGLPRRGGAEEDLEVAAATLARGCLEQRVGRRAGVLLDIVIRKAPSRSKERSASF